MKGDALRERESGQLSVGELYFASFDRTPRTVLLQKHEERAYVRTGKLAPD